MGNRQLARFKMQEVGYRLQGADSVASHKFQLKKDEPLLETKSTLDEIFCLLLIVNCPLRASILIIAAIPSA
jgi:hypothetical protein